MLVRDIQQALQRAELLGYNGAAPALCRSALVHLCRRLDPAPALTYRLLALSGGLSALFWMALRELGLLDVHVTVLEHESARIKQLVDSADPKAVHVVRQTLKTIDDDERERMFADPRQAGALWSSNAVSAPESAYTHYTIHNAFYGEAHEIAKRCPAAFDALIVDGPHGDGRSLAYPLLAAALKPGAWIIVDDFDHYPFLDDLARVLPYTEHYREVFANRRWVLLKLE